MTKTRSIIAGGLLAMSVLRCSSPYEEKAGGSSGGVDASAEGSSASDATSDGSSSGGDSGGADAGADVKIIPASATVWVVNGHAYEVVVAGTGIDYEGAKLQAEVRNGTT